MALASSSSVFISPKAKLPFHQNSRGLPSTLQLRAQNFEDHHHEAAGRHNLVDANLGILRKRIEEMKAKEKLKKCYERGSLAGWNHHHAHAPHTLQYSGSCSSTSRISSSADRPSEYVGVVGTFGLTILGGTLGLCLASVLVHLTQLSVVGIGP